MDVVEQLFDVVIADAAHSLSAATLLLDQVAILKQRTYEM